MTKHLWETRVIVKSRHPICTLLSGSDLRPHLPTTSQAKSHHKPQGWFLFDWFHHCGGGIPKKMGLKSASGTLSPRWFQARGRGLGWGTSCLHLERRAGHLRCRAESPGLLPARACMSETQHSNTAS